MVPFTANDKSEVVSSPPWVVLKRRLDNSKAVLEVGSVSVLSKEGRDLGIGGGGVSTPESAHAGLSTWKEVPPGIPVTSNGGDCERPRA